MKKLMIIAAVVLATVASQGASFVWSTSSKIADATGTAITTADGYSALLNGGSIVLVQLASASDWSTATVLDAGTNGNAANIVASGPSSKKGTLSSTYMFNGATASLKDGDILAVMFKDASGNLSQLQYADGTAVDTTFTISGLDAGGDTWDGGVFTYASGQTFTVAAVPEPTSGLLLLLGMAGLALRRKQA